jgi:hypothetical protein
LLTTEISEDHASLVELVQLLGDYLTQDDPVSRTKGTSDARIFAKVYNANCSDSMPVSGTGRVAKGKANKTTNFGCDCIFKQ